VDACPFALLALLSADVDSSISSKSKWDRFFGSKRLSEGDSSRSIACLLLERSLLKKLEDVPDEAKLLADKRALDKFLTADARCESYVYPKGETETDRLLLGEFRDCFHSCFLAAGGESVLNLRDIFSLAEVGPGSNVGVYGGDFYSKFSSSPMSMTSPLLYRFYKTCIGAYTLEVEAEKIRSASLGERVVKGSVLSFVPKTSEISRTICTEPLLNMFFQRGIGNILEGVLKRRFHLDLATQPDFNRVLADVGSREHEVFCTIDLASASDTISQNLLREVLDRDSFNWLNLVRSEFTELPNGELRQMNMISSMGNGYTFPLQTLLFASVVTAVYRVLGLSLVRNTRGRIGNFGVFGDDIIVRPRAYGLTCHLLGLLGFEVNMTKSYAEGSFRESCGADFWRGYNVRGVYCTSLKTKQDLYSLINRLNVWSCNHGVPLRSAVGYLLARVRFLPVPSYEPPISGIWTPSKALDEMQKDRRFGHVLYERYVSNPKKVPMHDVATAAGWPKRWNTTHGETTKVVHVDRSLASESFPEGWINNPPGIILAAVSGALRDGYVVPRQDRIRYSLRVAISPYWDWRDTRRRDFTDDGWARFKANGSTLTVKV